MGGKKQSLVVPPTAATTNTTMGIDSAAVEVVATVGFDGSIRTRSFTIPEPCKEVASLVDGCEEPSDQQRHHGKPRLVRVGSTSDSEEDDSTSSEKENGNDKVTTDPSVITKAISTEVAMPAINSVGTSEDRNTYDCLSDQITTMFCSSEQLCMPTLLANKSSSSNGSNGSENHQVTASRCTEVGCTEYQLKDFLNTDGTDVFTSFQFWLTPSRKEETSRHDMQEPHNRSSGSRKRRSKHVETLWKSWHGEQSIPLERSKSLPTEPKRPSIPSASEDVSLMDVCYDSDPEQEYRQRPSRGEALQTPAVKRNSFRDRRPVRIATIEEHDSCYLGTAQVPPAPRSGGAPSSKQFNFHPKDRKNSSSSTSSSTKSCPRGRPLDTPTGPSAHDLMSPEGEPFLRSFIQEATNTKIPLIWHRRTHGTEAIKRKAPLAVSCAFEVGAHLDTLVVQPKFTWSPTFEPHLPSRKIQLSGTEPDSIELLSIIRVVKPSHLNRNLYPFARLDRTCCITTNDEEFPYLVFEAGSTRERDWLVNAMKMIVARLASIIIVRDEAMLLEFFTPYAALMHLGEPTPANSSSETTQDGPQKETEQSTSPPLDSNGELQLVSYGAK